MSTLSLPASGVSVSGERPPGDDVQQLRSYIADRLERSGVHLPAGEVADIAEEAMAEAVRLCLAWLERAD